MENISKFSKFVLYFTVLLFVLWLGGYVTRQFLIFELFEPENLTLKSLYSLDTIGPVFYTCTSLLIYNIVTYILFLIFFILFVLSSRIKLKEEGWLFIIVILVLFTAPFELYLSYLDMNIVSDILNTEFDNGEILTQIRHRFTIFENFSLAEIFVYFGIIFFALFQPLRKK